MRRLTMTGFCAIALLSGCTGGGVGNGPPTVIKLPCPGKDVKTGDHHVGKNKTTIRFEADGNCKFTATGVQFDPPYGPIPQYPPGFSNRVADSSGKMISYDYKGTPPPIPTAGYPFSYENDDPQDGNGSGIIKN